MVSYTVLKPYFLSCKTGQKNIPNKMYPGSEDPTRPFPANVSGRDCKHLLAAFKIQNCKSQLKSYPWIFDHLINILPKCSKCSKSATIGPKKANRDLGPLRGDLNSSSTETHLCLESTHRPITWSNFGQDWFRGSGVMPLQRNGDFSVCDLYI